MSLLNYLPNCKVVSTVTQEENYEAWKAARGRGIGGSEIGAICGVSPYASARTIYMRKTERYDENFSEASKERMEWGHLLEPVVANKFASVTGKKIAISPATVCHKDHEWALANLDRFIVDDHGVPYGVLECKTAGSHMAEYWEEGKLPMAYVYQLQWYLYITGLTYGAYACLVGGNKFYYYEVFINEEFINEMKAKGSEFWNYNVKSLVEPELTGVDADIELMKSKYATANKGEEIAMTDLNELAEIVYNGKKKIKELENEVDEAANKIKDRLGFAETGYTTNFIVKWSNVNTKRASVDLLKTYYPDVYAQVCKPSSHRVFKVKEL